MSVFARALAVLCPTPASTERAGARLAAHLAPGDLVLLEGELGSGKTAFVRGLAAGLGAAPDEVASPTFALVHDYPATHPCGRLVHADLYRLPAGDVEDLGLDEARAGGAVVAVEWPRAPFLSLLAWRVRIREVEGGAREIRLSRA